MRPPLRVWTPYLLPNILTCLNLMAGFYAIISAIGGHYGRTVTAILLATVLDGLDGMAARLSRGSSAFGLEFDSLADLVSFGLAPSLFMYLWHLQNYRRIGVAAAFLFTACGALRLARFNVQSGDVQKHRFLGIPIPMAAAQLATTYLILNHQKVAPRTAGIIVVITTYVASFLMISNISFRSLKALSVRRRHSFNIPVLFILLVAIVWIHPQVTLWILSSTYLLSGPLEAAVRRVLAARLHGRPREKTTLGP